MCEIFARGVVRWPDAVALRTVNGSSRFTYAEYGAAVADTAAALFACGVRRHDVVALMFENRPEFHVVDAAAMQLGATTCSIYNTSPVRDIAHVIASSGAHIAVCESGFAAVLLEANADLRVLCTDVAVAGTEALADLPRADDFDVEAAWQQVRPDDVLTLIYTSGTTGLPKPVELTHRSMVDEVYRAAEVLDFRFGDRVPSALPMAHAAQRWGTHYSAMAFGLEVVCVDDITKLAASLAVIEPDIWGTVPRILEKMVTAISGRLDAEPDPQKRALVAAAIDVGQRFATAVEGSRTGASGPSEGLVAERARAEPVLARIRESLGLGRLRWLMVGAAPTPPHVLSYLAALGLEVVEVWGMSELSAVATINPAGMQRFGTVGRPLRGIEITLADDGEILVRGPILMRGYRGQAEATNEALSADGRLKTGDLGQLDDHGYLTITGRKKEIIVNAAGKNIAPVKVEAALLAQSPLIATVVAIGDNRPFLSALIVLDPDALAQFGITHELSATSPEVLLHCEEVSEAVGGAVTRANADLARVEQIKRYTVLGCFWAPGGEELTPTLKVRRRVIDAKYGADIAALYAAAEASR
jgi:long-subunit acyl-CoA synthetase (AMP-forming)